MNTTLVIGFDSAWSPNNSGAIVSVLVSSNGEYTLLGHPQAINFKDAPNLIKKWQKEYLTSTTLILIDQPTIVPNKHRQRPVENIVSSPVGRRYGGVQPANRSKHELFGDDAPIWSFLNNFDGPFNHQESLLNQLPFNCVIETYPVLAMIAMGWLCDDNSKYPRATKRLPKYNPDKDRKNSFFNSDWKYVCSQTATFMNTLGLPDLERWLFEAKNNNFPQKKDQDCLDACICLLVGMLMIEKKDCLLVGNMESGCMTIPYGKELYDELEIRCIKTKRNPSDWLRRFNFN